MRTAWRCASITYGGIITSLKVPDRAGQLGDIVLGFDTLDGYLEGSAVLRRASSDDTATALRRGSSRSTGKTYKLATNNGPNHLHGGIKGFDKVVWNACRASDANGVGVMLTRTSPDGEEGYPGNAAGDASRTR